MNGAVSERVRIGTCSGLAEVALVRSAFTAHDIHVVVGTEHHVGMLTGLGGGFASLDIWVDADAQEDALSLLQSLRQHDAGAGDLDGPCADGDAAHDGDDPACDARGDGDGDDEIPGELRQRIDRRRQTAVALLLGACVTFGTAHAFTRAWRRGALLMTLEAIGIGYLILGNPLGMAVVIATVVADVTGALWRIHGGTAGATGAVALPVARLHRR
jgi:hypothetical protein